MRALLAAILVLPPLAGCVGVGEGPAAGLLPLEAGLSKPVFERVVSEQMRVGSYDGVEIDTWVFRPDTPADVRVPVIINFSPYWGNLAPSAESGGDAFSRYLVEYFVPRGYAVALSSARGTGESDGCFTIGGPGELLDEVAVMDALAAAPWSSGNLTATGKSYDGTMAQSAAVTGHPALKAILPVSPISEFYKYNYVNGVPYDFTGQVFNTYYVATVGWQIAPGRVDPRLVQDLSCEDNPDVQRAQYESYLTGDYTPYWQARNYSAMASNVEAAVFYVHGLADWNVKPDHMEPWLSVLPSDVFVKKWLGQWEHDYPTRDDMNVTFLRFFDEFLKGVDTGIRSEPLAQVESTDGVWRNEDDWPPPGPAPLVLHLDAGGALSAAPGSGTASWRDEAGAGTGPLVSRAVYVSEPLAAPTRVAGVPHVSLSLAHTAPKGTVAATLYAVEGDASVDGPRVLDQGFLDLRHRNSLERSEPVVPGQAMRVSFSMYPQDFVVPAGWRIVLALSAASPPGTPVTVAPVPSFGTTTVAHGDASWISLPVVEDSPEKTEPAQPADVGCWAC